MTTNVREMLDGDLRAALREMLKAERICFLAGTALAPADAAYLRALQADAARRWPEEYAAPKPEIETLKPDFPWGDT